jgi:hypothetical protein
MKFYNLLITSITINTYMYNFLKDIYVIYV